MSALAQGIQDAQGIVQAPPAALDDSDPGVTIALAAQVASELTQHPDRLL